MIWGEGAMCIMGARRDAGVEFVRGRGLGGKVYEEVLSVCVDDMHVRQEISPFSLSLCIECE